MSYFLSEDLHLCLGVIRLGDSRCCYSSQTVDKERYNSAFYNQSLLYSPQNSPVYECSEQKHAAVNPIQKDRLLINDGRSDHTQMQVFRCPRRCGVNQNNSAVRQYQPCPAGTEKNDIIFL